MHEQLWNFNGRVSKLLSQFLLKQILIKFKYFIKAPFYGFRIGVKQLYCWLNYLYTQAPDSNSKMCLRLQQLVYLVCYAELTHRAPLKILDNGFQVLWTWCILLICICIEVGVLHSHSVCGLFTTMVEINFDFPCAWNKNLIKKFIAFFNWETGLAS